MRILLKTLRFGLEIAFVAVVVFLAVYIFEYVDQRSFLLDEKNITPGESYSVEGKSSFGIDNLSFGGNGVPAVVLGEEDESGLSSDEPVFESQNYSIRQITFGGDITIPLDQLENVPLKISNVRSELLTTRDEQETKLIVSWKTNKPALSEIVYGKNIEQGGATIKEDQFGYSHSAVLSSLDYSSAYTYLIKSQDKWSNELMSQQFAFYTGAPKISLVDLLFGAFKDIFSWAIKE